VVETIIDGKLVRHYCSKSEGIEFRLTTEIDGLNLDSLCQSFDTGNGKIKTNANLQPIKLSLIYFKCDALTIA
jgi:hypothetical protein